MKVLLPPGSCLWAGRAAPAWTRGLGLREIHAPGEVGDAPGLLVVGGGTRIDEAKALKHARPALRLATLPTLWGSGAEASPVIVLTRDGAKKILIDPAAVPDEVLYDEAVLAPLGETRIRHACADVWAHALEGCFSPLASPALQAELAALLRELLLATVGKDMRWFDWSARAAAGQARSGVGLAHGIAHVLEPVLEGWGHARLIAAALPAVLRFNRGQGDKWDCTARELGLDLDAVRRAVDALSEPEEFERLTPNLQTHWMAIARDPCSRMNSVLVRAGGLADLLHGC